MRQTIDCSKAAGPVDIVFGGKKYELEKIPTAFIKRLSESPAYDPLKSQKENTDISMQNEKELIEMLLGKKFTDQELCDIDYREKKALFEGITNLSNTQGGTASENPTG